MATHSSVLAWRIPGMGLHRVGHNWSDLSVACLWPTHASSVLSDSLWACSPPGSSVSAIFQVRILEWVAISYSRVSSWPRDWTYVSCVSCIAGRFFTRWAIREALVVCCVSLILQSSWPFMISSDIPSISFSFLFLGFPLFDIIPQTWNVLSFLSSLYFLLDNFCYLTSKLTVSCAVYRLLIKPSEKFFLSFI